MLLFIFQMRPKPWQLMSFCVAELSWIEHDSEKRNDATVFGWWVQNAWPYLPHKFTLGHDLKSVQQVLSLQHGAYIYMHTKRGLVLNKRWKQIKQLKLHVMYGTPRLHPVHERRLLDLKVLHSVLRWRLGSHSNGVSSLWLFIRIHSNNCLFSISCL